MRILIVGPEIRDRADIRDFGGVWSFYLTREFRRLGHEVVHRKALDHDPASWAAAPALEDVDHVVALGRFFSRVPQECGWIIADRVRGKVAQIHDRRRSQDPVDVTFSLIDAERPLGGINVPVGWASDPDVQFPRQDPDDFRILIDHPNYGEGRRIDASEGIAQQAVQFARSGAWRAGGWKRCTVRRLCDGGAETVTVDNVTPRPFTRQHVPFERLATEMGRAHLFMVTHPESAGLSVLEAAYSGALPVAPFEFIHPSLLATVRHVEYRGHDVPWEKALRTIDIPASREQALRNSWTRVATRILTYLEGAKND